MRRLSAFLLVSVLALSACAGDDLADAALPTPARLLATDGGCTSTIVQIPAGDGLEIVNQGTDALRFELPGGGIEADLDPQASIEIYPNLSPVEGVDADRQFFPTLTPGTLYDFACGTVDGTLTVVAQGAVPGGGEIPIPAPVGLVAAPVTETGLTLSWSMPSGTPAVIDGFEVFEDGHKIGETDVPAFTVASLECNTEYTYTVSAFDGDGDRSPQSEPYSTTTLAC